MDSPIDSGTSFFERVTRATEQAMADGSPCVVVRLRVASTLVEIRLGHPDLVPAFTGALAHLRDDVCEDAPDWVVHIWDSAHSGVALPRSPIGMEGVALRGEIPQLCSEGILVAFFPQSGMLTVADSLSRRAVVCLTDVRQLSPFEVACPLRAVLSWLLNAQETPLVHAAAVSTNAGAALLVGPSGAGKSTTALQCLSEGLGLLGDDLVALDGSGAPQVYSVYGHAKVAAAEVENFPRLMPSVVAGPESLGGKSVLAVGQTLPEGMVRRAPLRVVLLLDRFAAGAVVTRAKRGAVMGIIGSSTHSLLPAAGEPLARLLLRGLREMTFLRVRLSSEAADNADTIRRLIADPGFDS